MNANIKKSIAVPYAVSLGILLACTCACTSAIADDDFHSEAVKVRDLNINTESGVKTLYSRIHSAAKRVCFDTDPVLWTAQAACARKAEADAIGKAHLPQLTAYYRQVSGERSQSLIASR